MTEKTTKKRYSKKRKKVLDFMMSYSAGVVMTILILFNVLFTPNFAHYTTIANIIIQMTSTMLIALGMTWVIASGGIDISVGAVMAVASMVSVKLLPYNFYIAILGALVIGTFCGMTVGFIISRFKIQPIIVTLPFMIGLRGVAQILNNSKILRFSSEQYAMLGRAKISGNIPVQIFIMLSAIIVIWIITTKTVFGKKIEAIGDNLKASRLAGVNTMLVLIGIYGTIAFLSSIAGIVDTARLYASDANTLGKAIEMDAIAAVAIGGTNMSGGKPNIMGTVFGAVIMQIMTTMVSMNDIPYQYALVLKAAIIIIALYGQRVLRTRKEAIL